MKNSIIKRWEEEHAPAEMPVLHVMTDGHKVHLAICRYQEFTGGVTLMNEAQTTVTVSDLIEALGFSVVGAEEDYDDLSSLI